MVQRKGNGIKSLTWENIVITQTSRRTLQDCGGWPTGCVMPVSHQKLEWLPPPVIITVTPPSKTNWIQCGWSIFSQRSQVGYDNIDGKSILQVWCQVFERISMRDYIIYKVLENKKRNYVFNTSTAFQVTIALNYPLFVMVSFQMYGNECPRVSQSSKSLRLPSRFIQFINIIFEN